MSVTLAFDVYGTLIDTRGVVSTLRGMVGDRAEAFSQLWRDKQLEYSFRRGLMRKYESFVVCTRDALEYACRFLRITLSQDQKDELLRAYRTLPAFAEVAESLSDLRQSGYRLFAFSNGSATAVEALLTSAGIRECFLGIVSVDEIKTFKPDPGVYSLFLRTAAVSQDNAWLISSNPFDVIGAISVGMRAAWVQRSPEAVFDPWGIEPTLIVKSLADLKDAMRGVK